MIDLHTCSHECERLPCVKAQRRQLHAENERLREAARMALAAIEATIDDSNASLAVNAAARDALRDALDHTP